MEGIYKNKYKINSARLSDWDYSNDGIYFITICTKDRKCFLGFVKNKVIGLSEIGCVVWKYWHELPMHYSCINDEFIVMPNHIHALIEIKNNSNCRDGACPVSTQGKKYTLSNIVGSFKSACTNKIHKLGYNKFQWQSRFYDHLIRVDQESLEKIRYYIKYNPMMWDRDRNNLEKK